MDVIRHDDPRVQVVLPELVGSVFEGFDDVLSNVRSGQPQVPGCSSVESAVDEQELPACFRSVGIAGELGWY